MQNLKDNLDHIDQSEKTATRLCNCFQLVKELFPESRDMDALLLADAIRKALFKD